MVDRALTQALIAHANAWGIDLVGITGAEILRTHTYTVSRETPYRCGQQRVQTEIAPDVFDPRLVMPGAQAILILATYTYGLDQTTPSTPGCPRGKIGPWTRLYETMSQQMADCVSTFLSARGFQAVFTNDLPYRTLALKAGLGGVGRNHFLFTPSHGSYLRLSCVMTDAPLETADHSYAYDVSRTCGRCRLCEGTCPTGAMGADGTLQYDICLHQLLQGKGAARKNGIPRAYWGRTMGYLMRTGHCLEVCPRNRGLPPRESVPRFMRDYPDADKDDSPPLIPLVNADDAELMARLPIAVYKYGLDHVRQNAILALGQAGDPAAIEALAQCLLSSRNARHAAMAAWALGCTGDSAALRPLQQALALRQEAQVLEEINAALDTLGAAQRQATSKKEGDSCSM